MIKQILTENNFLFDDQHYLQVHGTAMGTQMAPSYANIFMGHLEDGLLASTSEKPDVWWRYIDSVFALWSHGEEALKMIVESINQAHPTIKFTVEWSRKKVILLDVAVKRENETLMTVLICEAHQHTPVPGL